MKNKTKIILILFIGLFINTLSVKAEEISINYTSFIQDKGWINEVSDGEQSGTVGKAKRLEGLKINLSDPSLGNVEYITYLQSYGWEESWKKDGEETGKIEKHKRIEAIKIRLKGEISNQYDIYYRVHSQTYGWLPWAKNGETSGTIGLAKRIEAIEIKLIIRGTGEETKDTYKSNGKDISYSSHVQTYGWLEAVSSGISGTEGKGKRLEAYKIVAEFAKYSGSIQYKSFIEGIGWENEWKSMNQISGTVGQAKKIEEIQMKLTGEIEEYYDIYYRVHVQGFGWLGWAKNGESAGTENLNFRIESFEIKIIEKGTGEETGNSIETKDAKIYYEAYAPNENFNEVEEGQMAGTIGRGLGINSFKIRLETNLIGNILYQAYTVTNGWEESWKKQDEISPTTNDDKITQIRIKLEDEMSEKYDVYYRVHASHVGWLDWAKNGESAGSSIYNIEAIEIRLFLKIDSSKNQLPTKDHYIEFSQKIPTYYCQKDPRWDNKYYGKKKFGNTGCAPTSMAMAFTGILNRVILPTEIADYLYHHTNEFNKKTVGSSGLAIIYASNFFGIKYKALSSQEEIRKELLKGNIIYAAMGNGKYGTKNWNHAIVFFQYNTGSTYAYDPLNSSNNGWIPINQLWNEQSKDPDDYSGGSNFYSLEAY